MRQNTNDEERKEAYWQLAGAAEGLRERAERLHQAERRKVYEVEWERACKIAEGTREA